MVTSFTRTAALEVKGRNLPIPDKMVGTLHSMAYRAIDSPAMHLSQIKDWNDTHPSYALTGGGSGSVEEAPAEWTGATDGDKIMADVDILRAKMLPVEGWPESRRHFFQLWQEWKAEAGVIDFTDMLEVALESTTEAPGRPEVIFADEQQDSTPLELELLRKWGEKADRVILAGDDDQCLYRFRGADPKALIDLPVPEHDRIILGQSYRVPAEVLKVADRWVHTITHRQEKAYLPRDADGAVTVTAANFASEDMVAEITRRIDAGKSVMCLASCGYMLDKLKGHLRRFGVPFWNPYRPTRGDWNPMHMGTERTTSATERLLAYLVMDEEAFGDASRLWTGRDVKAWASFIKSTGVFRRGAKGVIEGLPDRELSYEEVAGLFASTEELEAAVEPSLEWFASHLTAQGAKALEFPIQVYRQRGPSALTERPGVMLGTVHSFKGAEADSVLLCPDLSYSASKEWGKAPGEARDSVIRLFYVAMTRAREELVVCAPSGAFAVDLTPALA